MTTVTAPTMRRWRNRYSFRPSLPASWLSGGRDASGWYPGQRGGARPRKASTRGKEKTMTNESDIPIIGRPVTQQQTITIEVCRSFAYKLNLANVGGPQYESVDFFASRKMACAAEGAAWVSQQIYEECVAEVREATRLFIEDLRAKKGARMAEQQQRRAG